MIKEVKTNWRPLLELTELALDETSGEAVETGNTFYYNYAKASDLIQTPQGTVIVMDNLSIRVKESVKDIYKKIDKIMQAEADRIAEEARRNMEEQAKRMEQFKAKDN
jgi:chromosome condensin MukBEF complex kleisin-like MukF subunit